MRFRDLAIFNDYLLSKQAWWLLHDTKTLFYRIFKAHFFPYCSIIEAKESASGSYAWKSTLYSRDVIQRGSCWRVGDGRSIKIWQHHWLPIKLQTKIASPVVETMGEATVYYLVDVELRQWISERFERIFL